MPRPPRRPVAPSDTESHSGSEDDESGPENKSHPLIDDEALSESDDDESGSESESNPLIDDEALDSSDDDEVSSSSSGDDEPERGTRPSSFTRFMDLPPELRTQVWRQFCPDLDGRPRVLQFEMGPGGDRKNERHLLRDAWDLDTPRGIWTVKEWITLAEQTESLRRLMAVHQESRSLGLKAFPDTLTMDSGTADFDARVAFNPRKDIVAVDHFRRESYGSGEKTLMPGFGDIVVNMAVPRWNDYLDRGAVQQVKWTFDHMPNIQRLYISADDEQFKHDRHVRWCASDYVHRYRVETHEKEPGFGEDLVSLFCWPDVDNHPDFAKYQLPARHMRSRPKQIGRIVEERGVEVLPMVIFEFDDAIRRFEQLFSTKDLPYDATPSASDDSDDEEDDEDTDSEDIDEYESEGIDDEPIEEFDESGEGESSVDEDSDAAGARFSSPEGSIGDAPAMERLSRRAVVLDSDDEDEPKQGLPNRQRKRKIATDSDDEDDAVADGPQAKRARTGSAPAADPDMDSDDAPPTKRGGARAHVVAESDSETDDGAGAKLEPNGVTESSDEDTDGSSQEGDQEDEEPRRLTLAERLQRHREAHPIPVSDSEPDSSNEEQDEDDEEEDEDDEDESGLINDMASESDGEGDEDGESEGW
ncbi:hypothetical protein JDV02_002079 [Purpureocillium takamizusanense]|uniref:2EXR domain-containing protein n=1 Tax=Purpureocillium takamizusanense TaxID=2060973 RepID=A0A9Q8Q9J4_9HYPO|nr:uncharacterized protein JDV02_002079 [Purpureocillium takamizusanense]UNI15555.1 hypothetical protein JDV02_002079 [Purpureocillium takamizusanense]